MKAISQKISQKQQNISWKVTTTKDQLKVTKGQLETQSHNTTAKIAKYKLEPKSIQLPAKDIVSYKPKTTKG